MLATNLGEEKKYDEHCVIRKRIVLGFDGEVEGR